MAFPLGNLAGIETVKGKYNEAISYYQDYFDIQSDIGHQKRLSHGNYYLGSTLVKNGDLNNALPYLDKAIDIQTELGLKDELVESEIYRALCLKKLNEEFEMDRVIELVDSTELSYDSFYYLYDLSGDGRFLDSANVKLDKTLDELEPQFREEYKSYPIPKTIIQEWKKVQS